MDKIVHTGKELRLLVHLEDAKQSGKPLVIFAVFQPQHDRIVAMFKATGLRVALINGSVSASKRGQIDEDFQAGLIDVVVASAATASVGYNWPHVDTIVFMSLDFMDSSFLQGYRRAMRGVRTSPLLVYVMEYIKSMDQRVMQIVEIKSAVAVEVDPTQTSVKITSDHVPGI